ncbi:MAG: ATP-binding protein [Rhodospirillaceae bacterium]
MPDVDADEWERHLTALVNRRPFRNFTHPRTMNDGSVIWLAISETPVFDDRGAFQGYCGVGRDITQRRQAEDALLVARNDAEKASRAKSEFLAAMSHEIRTPMTGVMGLVDLLAQNDIDDDSREMVYRIKDSTRVLLEIINDILDMSKLEAGRVELEFLDFHLPSLIRETVEMFSEKRSGGRATEVKIVTDLDDGFPIGVNSDPTRLRQVFVNLIGNAKKFTKMGTITVRGRVVDGDRDAKILRFEVADTGIGIKPEILDGLFTEFTQADVSITRKYEGTGLGLSICKKLVTLMNGEIGVDSVYGEGSTFWFTVPFAPATSHVEALDQLPKSVAFYKAARPLHILVVDDNNLNRQIITAMLERIGHGFEVAEHGMQAVEMHEAGQFDLILMDVLMPVMSGPDATRLIRKPDADKSGVPIIALTADAMHDHQEGYLEAGMNDVVAKPIDHAVLALSINAVLGEAVNVPATVAGPAPEPEPEPDPDTEAANLDAVNDFLKQIDAAPD